MLLLPLARLQNVLSALLVSAATFALAACGGSDADAGSGPGGKRTITDAQGVKVTVPNYPRRVVTLSEPTLDGALAVGLRPIATTGGGGQGGVSSYLDKQARDIPNVGVLGRPDIEHIEALKPDLILLDGTAVQDDAVVDRLRDLAPTVYVSNTGQDWRTAFIAQADATNRQKEAAHLLGEFDTRVAEVRASLGRNAGAEVSVVRWGGTGRPSVLMKDLAVGRTLAALGLERPPSQDQRGPGHPVPISLQDLRDIDGDWIFLGAPGTGSAGDAPADAKAARHAIRTARATPGFTRLKAVRAGHLVAVDGSAWTSAGGPIAERVVVDDVARALAAPSS